MRQIFCKLRECEIKNNSKSVIQILKNFDSKRDSPQQINCENFIVGCSVGFKKTSIKDRLLRPWTRIDLRMPFIQARAHVTPCIASEKARVN